MDIGIIDQNRIISAHEKTTVSSLDALTKHVKNRQHYFINALELAINSPGQAEGWQKFSQSDTGQIKKHDLSRNKESGVFTGSLWCIFSSLALAMAVEDMTQDSQNFSIEVGEVNTSYNGEEWHKTSPSSLSTSPTHTIMKVTDKTTSEAIYYDPTYAQINHKYAGQIVVIPESEFQTMYQNPQGRVTFSTPARYNVEEYRRSIRESVFNGEEKFNRLVNTIN